MLPYNQPQALSAWSKRALSIKLCIQDGLIGKDFCPLLILRSLSWQGLYWDREESTCQKVKRFRNLSRSSLHSSLDKTSHRAMLVPKLQWSRSSPYHNAGKQRHRKTRWGTVVITVETNLCLSAITADGKSKWLAPCLQSTHFLPFSHFQPLATAEVSGQAWAGHGNGW